MLGSISHRGPDGEGEWHCEKNDIWLGHRRLAIQDLSDNGAQPMASQSGDSVIVFNGEIYNHLQLRELIERKFGEVGWRGMSDTETLLEGIEHFGAQAFLPKLRGMYAFGLWNRRHRSLLIARDPSGEKPLFFRQNGDTLQVGSSVDSIIVGSEDRHSLNREVLAEYLISGYVSGRETLLSGIQKLEPGWAVEFVNPVEEPNPVVRPLTRFRDSEESTSPEGLPAEVEWRLSRAVNRQLISDVPVGLFLSGGLDSALVAVEASKLSELPPQAFTIAVDDPNFDESPRASWVAKRLGLDHRVERFTQDDLLEMLDPAVEAYDEPLGDPSLIPTMFLSRFASRTVSVALSGDGSDELFGGYFHYKWGSSAFRWGERLGPYSRAIIGRLLRAAPKHHKFRFLGDRLGETDESTFLYFLRNDRRTFDALTPEARNTSLRNLFGFVGDSLERKLMTHDFNNYLANDILVKVDRASMWFGLETRMPFLDTDLVDFVGRQSDALLGIHKEPKYIVKELTRKHFGAGFVSSDKKGFSIPLDQWTRKSLVTEVVCALEELDGWFEGIIETSALQQSLDDHLSSRQNNGIFLFRILMLSKWIKKLQHRDKLCVRK